MARKKESALLRIARHLEPAITPEELEELLDEGAAECLIWTGAFVPKRATAGRRPVPHMADFGLPARPLLAHIHGVERVDQYVHLRNNCGNSACVNPRHYDLHAVRSRYYDRRGIIPSPSAQDCELDEEEVQAVIKLLDEGRSQHEVEGFCRPEAFREALVRRVERLLTMER